jgi:hypothetical protein
MDFNPTPFNLVAGFVNWLVVTGIITAVALVLGLILSVGRSGPGAFGRGLKSFFQDLVAISPGRVMAITILTIREAVRRKALLVFVVFALLLMFGGWFLSDAGQRAELQVNVHITFMLTVMSWLILPAIMFLSCWGIPEDIRLRSLHTVVTKPTRRVEVVLGRMLGFGSVASVVLVVMAVIGYVWIQRQVPAGVKDKLICRVPVYGEFYFLDRQGLPTTVGINVGDAWEYRSHIEGNTQSRAIWTFSGITPDQIGENLRLESRFEAFRTIKGSEDTIREGLEARYTLVNDPREVAFSFICVTASFRDFGQQLREGQFENAATTLSDAAGRMRTTRNDFPLNDCRLASGGFINAANVLGNQETDLKAVAEGFALLAQRAAEIQGPDDEVSYESMAQAADDLAATLADNAALLSETLPRLEVPLEPFRVLEYHEGENENVYPHDLKFAADEESLARHLALTISALNEQGALVANGQLADDAVNQIASGHQIEQLNAELLVSVLGEELEGGSLQIEGNQLAVADGRLWLQFFDQIVRQGRLPSQYPEGWELTVNLFEDLAPEGRLRIEVSCLNDQMFVGMARPDLFVRLPNRSFAVGYSKAVLNIALMLLLVVVLAVTASCAVKGPVSFFLTLSVYIIGQFFHRFMLGIISGQTQGSGLVESAMLIFQHRNPNVGIDANEGTQSLVHGADSLFTGLLAGVSRIVPDFGTFSGASTYIENGFDVPWASSVLPAIATFFGFLIPCVLIGTACLKFRELESK